jgi:hypothetical protein
MEEVNEKSKVDGSNNIGIVSENNLEAFVSANYFSYSLDSLKQEAIKKGYGGDLFDRVYQRVGNSEKNRPKNLTNPTTQLKDSTNKDLVLIPIEKDKLTKILKESENNLGNFFAPTQIMTYSFCIILLLALGGSMFSSFSLESFVSDAQNLEGEASSFKIGYPWIFVTFSLLEEDPFLFYFWEFLGDFILYILLSYIIDLTLSNSFRAIKGSIKNANKEEISDVLDLNQQGIISQNLSEDKPSPIISKLSPTTPTPSPIVAKSSSIKESTNPKK